MRPLLGPVACRYPPGCTQFAVEQLKEKSFFSALFIITRRVLSCNPFFSLE